MKRIKKKCYAPLIKNEAKMKKIQRFIIKKVAVKYFELGLIGLNWNYHYLQRFNLKGSEPDTTEGLKIYNAILALRFSGKERK